jgi:hypothetical protein
MAMGRSFAVARVPSVLRHVSVSARRGHKLYLAPVANGMIQGQIEAAIYNTIYHVLSFKERAAYSHGMPPAPVNRIEAAYL